MYTVYKITNLINHKCYIGSSNNVEKRWASHKKASVLPSSNSYNYPLQCAFRKYGLNNFYFEILRDDFVTRFDAEEYEKEMIIKYNSLVHYNGYNQTVETHNELSDEALRQHYLEKHSQKCAKIDKNNNILEVYASYQDAARKNQIPQNASSIRKVCKGLASSCNGAIYRDLDDKNNIIYQPFLSYKNRKQIIAIKLDNPNNKLYFDSVLSASRELQVDRSSLQKCLSGSQRYTSVGGYIFREIDYETGEIIENNISINEIIQKYEDANPIINGERHNISEWAKIYNISTQAIYRRKKQGMNIIEAITKPRKGG